MLKSNDRPLTRSRLAYECCDVRRLTSMRRDRRRGAPLRRSFLFEGQSQGTSASNEPIGYSGVAGVCQPDFVEVDWLISVFGSCRTNTSQSTEPSAAVLSLLTMNRRPKPKSRLDLTTVASKSGNIEQQPRPRPARLPERTGSNLTLSSLPTDQDAECCSLLGLRNVPDLRMFGPGSGCVQTQQVHRERSATYAHHKLLENDLEAGLGIEAPPTGLPLSSIFESCRLKRRRRTKNRIIFSSSRC